MKTIIGILLAIVMALVWRLNTEMDLNRQQQSHVVELTAKLNSKTASESLELQGKCSQQAQSVFLQLGYKNGGLDVYESHYNPKLTKCFMTIYSMNMNGGAITQNLFDAYEQKQYATYFWMPDKVKKYWEVPPKICSLNPGTPNETVCKSEDEYKAFVARYMQ
jgi:hypothetical protein